MMMGAATRVSSWLILSPANGLTRPRNKQLRLRPLIEELKTVYCMEIQTFVAMPLHFKGLDGAPHLYKVMPDRNQQAPATVFRKAEEMEMEKRQDIFKIDCFTVHSMGGLSRPNKDTRPQAERHRRHLRRGPAGKGGGADELCSAPSQGGLPSLARPEEKWGTPENIITQS